MYLSFIVSQSALASNYGMLNIGYMYRRLLSTLSCNRSMLTIGHMYRRLLSTLSCIADFCQHFHQTTWQHAALDLWFGSTDHKYRLRAVMNTWPSVTAWDIVQLNRLALTTRQHSTPIQPPEISTRLWIHVWSSLARSPFASLKCVETSLVSLCPLDVFFVWQWWVPLSCL